MASANPEAQRARRHRIAGGVLAPIGLLVGGLGLWLAGPGASVLGEDPLAVLFPAAIALTLGAALLAFGLLLLFFGFRDAPDA